MGRSFVPPEEAHPSPVQIASLEYCFGGQVYGEKMPTPHVVWNLAPRDPLWLLEEGELEGHSEKMNAARKIPPPPGASLLRHIAHAKSAVGDGLMGTPRLALSLRRRVRLWLWTRRRYPSGRLYLYRVTAKRLLRILVGRLKGIA